jgi:hypothetical protein
LEVLVNTFLHQMQVILPSEQVTLQSNGGNTSQLRQVQHLRENGHAFGGVIQIPILVFPLKVIM